jgi:hypothetical protein
VPTGSPLRLLINCGRSKVEIRRVTAQTRCEHDPLHPHLSRSSALKNGCRHPPLSRRRSPTRNQNAKVIHSAAPENLDDPQIHIRPTVPAISGRKAKEPSMFKRLRRGGSFNRQGFFAESVKSQDVVPARLRDASRRIGCIVSFQ